jgi:hypothetical protein
MANLLPVLGLFDWPASASLKGFGKAAKKSKRLFGALVLRNS